MNTAVVLVLVTLLGLGAKAWPQVEVADPALPAVPQGFGAMVITAIGEVDVQGVGHPPGTRAHEKLPLRNATRLAALSDDAELSIACANGGTQLLSDRFIAIINRAGAPSNCAIELEVGNAFATASPDGGEAGKSSLEDGKGLLGALSGRTQFGMSVPPGDASGAEVFVVEGDADVWRGTKKLNLTAGQQFVARTATITAVPEARYRMLAANLARVDVARAGPTVSAAAKAALQQSYYDALRKPGDPAARRALVEQYETFNVPQSQITRYNVKRYQAIKPAIVVPPTPMQPKPVVGPKPIVADPKFFSHPTLFNYRVDYCLHWGQQCGAPAADEFCRRKGFSRHVSFEVANDVGAKSQTLVLGDNKLCGELTCDGFASIRCE